MGRSGKRSGCLRFGCLSVLVLVGLSLCGTVILFGAAFIGSRTESVTRQELQQPVERPSSEESTTQYARLDGAGLLVVDFEVGEFTILPGKPGEPIRVEAKFDKTSYALEESFEPGGDDGWIYRLTFRQTGLIKDGGLRILFGASYPDLRVFVPPDVPIALRGRFGKGGAELELGGLWLTDIDLELEKGGLDVNVGRPLVEPIRSFRVHGKQGGMSTSMIGNASPARVDIYWQQGGSAVDLRGQWLNDSDVSIRSRMGGSQIQLPRGVRIEGLPGRGPLLAPSDDEVPLPTLHMSTSSAMGGQQIRN
jgi:hypothetical protein